MSRSIEYSGALAAILEQLADRVKTLSERDLEGVLNGKLRVEIKLVRALDRSKGELRSRTGDEYQILLESLQACDSRQDAELFLEDNFPTKRTLAEFARFLDIPVLRRDKVGQLREKVIEATVGALIRSRAIQGHEV